MIIAVCKGRGKYSMHQVNKNIENVNSYVYLLQEQNPILALPLLQKDFQGEKGKKFFVWAKMYKKVVIVTESLLLIFDSNYAFASTQYVTYEEEPLKIEVLVDTNKDVNPIYLAEGVYYKEKDGTVFNETGKTPIRIYSAKELLACKDDFFLTSSFGMEVKNYLHYQVSQEDFLLANIDSGVASEEQLLIEENLPTRNYYEIPVYDNHFQDFIYDTALQYKVPYKVVFTILEKESGHTWASNGIESQTHDLGLSQINRQNLAFIEKNYGYTEEDVKNDPYINVECCIRLLRDVYMPKANFYETRDYEEVFGLYNGWVKWRSLNSSCSYVQSAMEIMETKFAPSFIEGEEDIWESLFQNELVMTESFEEDSLEESTDENIEENSTFLGQNEQRETQVVEEIVEQPTTIDLSLYDLSGYQGVSIVEALLERNLDASYTHRKELATFLGIPDYTGADEQNLRMITLLGGNQKEEMNEPKTSEEIETILDTKTKELEVATSVLLDPAYQSFFQKVEIQNSRMLSHAIFKKQEDLTSLLDLEYKRREQILTMVALENVLENIEEEIKEEKKGVLKYKKQEREEQTFHRKKKYQQVVQDGFIKMKEKNLLSVTAENKMNHIFEEEIPFGEEACLKQSFISSFYVDTKTKEAFLQEDAHFYTWEEFILFLTKTQRRFVKKLFSFTKNEEGYYSFLLTANERELLIEVQDTLLQVLNMFFQNQKDFRKSLESYDTTLIDEQVKKIESFLGEGSNLSRENVAHFIEKTKEQLAFWQEKKVSLSVVRNKKFAKKELQIR